MISASTAIMHEFHLSPSHPFLYYSCCLSFLLVALPIPLLVLFFWVFSSLTAVCSLLDLVLRHLSSLRLPSFELYHFRLWHTIDFRHDGGSGFGVSSLSRLPPRSPWLARDRIRSETTQPPQGSSLYLRVLRKYTTTRRPAALSPCRPSRPENKELERDW